MNRTVIATIAIKRILLNLRTFRFAAGTLVCLSLIVASGFASIHDFKQRTDYCQALELEHQRTLARARSYSQISGRLILKPPALSPVSEGIGERFGLAANIPGRVGPVEVFGRTNANSFLLAFPSLDLAHVLGLLLTLMALLFTYDAVSGECESGTLRLALANRLPRYKVIVGEYLGALLSLTVPLLGCFLLWLLLIRVYAGIIFDLGDWLRLSLILLCSGLVVSLFALLGMLISCLTRQASTSIILCLFLWVFLGALSPDLSSWAATKIAPLSLSPSRELGPVQPADAGFPSRAKLREMLTLPPEQAKARAKEFERQSRQTSRRLLTSAKAEKDAEFRQMVNQAKLAEIFQDLSPISAYMQAASILSGTDLGNYIRFRTEARRLNRELARWKEEKMRKYPQPDTRFQVSLDLSDLPRPRFQPEPLTESMSRMVPPVGVILAFHILSFLVAFVAFIRYDPR